MHPRVSEVSNSLSPWRKKSKAMPKLGRLAKDETAITALETAILMLAFVVVAAVFSSAILSAGTYSTQKSKEAVYAGLSQLRGTLMLREGIIARSDAARTQVMTITFTLAVMAGGEAVDLTGPPNNSIVIDYSDENQYQTDVQWTTIWLGTNDGDNLLEEGEVAEIVVPLALSSPLEANTAFSLQVKPGRGAVLVIDRRTPAAIYRVMDLR